MPTQTYAGTTAAVDFPPSDEWLNTDHPLTLKELRGKIILLDFWTYCCINCMHVLPDLHRLEQEFPELVIVGVHSAKFQNEKDAENIRQAILRYDIEHPVIADGDFNLWQHYNIRAWPSFVLIDPAGKYVGNTSGEGVYAKLQPIIAGLSKEFAAKDSLNRTPLHFALERNHQPGALLSYPGKIVADATQHRLFFTDSGHNRIIITNATGQILEVIGTGTAGQQDGAYDKASFLRPQGLAYDDAKGILYVADTDNHLIREVNLTTRTVSTVLGTGQQATSYAKQGQGTTLALNSPWDVQLLNGQLYIAMAGPHQLWVMNPSSYTAQVYAGSGQENLKDAPLAEAALAQPSGITTDGKLLYFADSETSSIRQADATAVKTLIGKGLFDFGDVDGAYPNARLQHCIGVYYHQGKLYVADTYNHKIKLYNPATGQLTTLLGTGKRGNRDGAGKDAEFSEPNGITYLDGKFYLTDTNNGLIRVYDAGTDKVSTLAFAQPGRLSMLEAQKTAHKNSSTTAVPFYGESVALPAQTAQAGTTKLTIHLQVPKGYHLNEDAPNYLQLVTGSEAGAPQVQLQQTAEALSATVPVQLTPELKELKLEAGVYYCEEGRDARCLIKQLQFTLPLQVQAQGPAQLQLNYQLAAPK